MTSIAPNHASTEELYWEARGAGQPVLLVAGTPGDGGQFERVATELSEDHLVIAYDRRGTSRSAPAADWSTTSVGEQADDAAAVLSAVGVGPAIVFGTSHGAAVALELALRHPRRVAGAMLHEMPLLSVLHDPEAVASAMGSVIGSAMQAGGPPAALESFLRFAFGDQIVEEWAPDLRQRLLSNAEMVFAIELPAFQSYRPDPETLARCSTPVSVLVGDQQQLPFFDEAAQWLARHLGIEVNSTPGAHGPQFSCPDALAASIRAFAGSVTAA
jgi:pimeloyl-ACP methyl ester carboxylesterase